MCKKSRKVKFRVLPFCMNVLLDDGDAVKHITQDVEEINGVIHFNGDVTVVVLEDGSKGIATKGREDAYNEEVAIQVAGRRALVEMLQKEIKEISAPKVLPTQK